jgi:hypothetical protein
MPQNNDAIDQFLEALAAKLALEAFTNNWQRLRPSEQRKLKGYGSYLDMHVNRLEQKLDEAEDSFVDWIKGENSADK